MHGVVSGSPGGHVTIHLVALDVSKAKDGLECATDLWTRGKYKTKILYIASAIDDLCTAL